MTMTPGPFVTASPSGRQLAVARAQIDAAMRHLALAQRQPDLHLIQRAIDETSDHARLLVEHYDPAYRRSSQRNFAQLAEADPIPIRAASKGRRSASDGTMPRIHATSIAAITR